MAMSESTQSTANTNLYATFTVNDLYFGVEVCKVQEVLRYQAMTRIPLAPKVLRGLINLRGQIVTAIDIRERLRLPPDPDSRMPMSMIVRTGEGAVSFLVDEIGEVIDLNAATFEPCPETLDLGLKEVIDGVHKLDGRLLLVLNTDRTLALPEAA